MLFDYIDIVDLVKELHSVDLSMYTSVFVKNTIQDRMRELSIDSVPNYCGYIRQNKPEGLLLTQTFLNNHSLFFRDPLTYSLLETTVIPSIFKRKQDCRSPHIRVWSMACSAGQEPYSIAILLNEYVRSFESKFSYQVLATDVSQLQIDKAQNGTYSGNDLIYMGMGRVQNSFTKMNGSYKIKDECKQFVTFSRFDLLEDELSHMPFNISNCFDIVFCCNVLYYYTSTYQKIILDKAVQSLSKNGFLVVGETERKTLLDNYKVRSIDVTTSIFS